MKNQSTAPASLLSPATLALAALGLSMLLSSLGSSIANVGLPTLAREFGASFQEVQWVVLAYLLVITSLIVSAGRLGDLIGRRRLMLAGLALFTLGSALCGLAPSLRTLIAARIVQGLGAAAMMALTMAFVSDTVAREKTGSAMGLLGTMSALGTALGPSLGGLLIAHFHWHTMFLINVPLGMLACLLAVLYLPADRPAAAAAAAAQAQRFDLPGTLLLAFTLSAYAMAMTAGGGKFGLLNAALLLAAGLGLVLFIGWQRRAAAPLVPLAALCNRAWRAGLSTSALVTTVVMATLVVGPFYLSGALGLDAGGVGLVMSSGPLAAALTGAPAGRLVDRFGAARMIRTGLAAMAIGCAMLPLLSESLGVPGYVAALVFITVAYALFQAANNTAIMRDVLADQRGVIGALLNLSRNLGLVSGASLMGAVFAYGTAHQGSLAGGLQLTFAVSAGLMVVALMLVRPRQSRPAQVALLTPGANGADALAEK